jgi:hypothetical protein
MPVTIQIFDPAMCCATGVCGPSIDPELARISGDLEWLRGQGIAVERFNLAQQPGAFAGAPLVQQALQERGVECLPLFVIDGRIVAEGTYPARETLAALAGIVVQKPVAAAAKSCCPPKTAGEPKCC